MRHMFLALALAAAGGFAAASCGNGNNNNMGDMGHDMSGGPTPDMVIVKVNCLGVGFCVANCPATEDAATCFNMCMKQAKTGSYSKWGAAFVCAQKFCTPDPDAGMTGPCVRTCDPQNANNCFLCAPGQTFADCMMGTTQTMCTACLDNALAIPLIGDGTTPPTGMCDTTNQYCTGVKQACAMTFNACVNDP